MKKLLVAALVSGQIPGTAAPAFAQHYAPVRETDAGAFGGVRVRIPFGGSAREPARAGIAFAPTTRTDYQDGRIRTRFGEGLEFGYRTGRPLALSVAGRDLSSFRLNAAQGEQEQQRRRRGGPSTLGWIAIGVGVSLVIFVSAVAICASDSDCIPSE
jgi:hypothetical protein